MGTDSKQINIKLPEGETTEEEKKSRGDRRRKEKNLRFAPRQLKTLEKVWANCVVLAYVPQVTGGQKRHIYEPSFGYTLRQKNGLFVDTYQEKGGNVEVVRCTDTHKPYLMGVSAGFLMKDCIE
ncbi:hypothetical protein [Pasteurella multocida]|uniref:hypothetical protein n=1 Tax=Pasteurella multocida TaxID=747 RepID=UPI00244C1FB1|nr:hypothetical protein [Pasteurella multocida]MDH3002077.1 hypothetical protein [Pasteurella multocida]